MSKSKYPCDRDRFPPEKISQVVGLYHRFTLSFRDIGEIMATRGIQTSYESLTRWRLEFPREYTKSLRKHQGKLGNIWCLDEVFISVGVNGNFFGGPLIRSVQTTCAS